MTKHYGLVDRGQLRQLGPTPLTPSVIEGLPPDGEVAMIVKVRKPAYVPVGAKLRKQLGPFIFTADVPVRLVAALERDPGVESLAVAERLDLIEPR